jgi:hypothetical protein
MQSEDRFHTELDNELRNLAILEWAAFVRLVGEENITNAKICLLRRKSTSYGLIQLKLGVTKEKVRHNTKQDKCECPEKVLRGNTNLVKNRT